MWAFFVGDFMAIQTVDLTVPGGDTPRSANIKINANFSNTTHAASRLVGPVAGNVMEVGAFGIGGNYLIQSGVLLKDQHINGFGSARITTGAGPADAPNAQIGKVLYIGDPTWGSQVWFSYDYGKVYFRNKQTGSEYESWKEFYHSGTPNLAANSIQIGVGAPKIAYKKIVDTFSGSAAIKVIPHGLNVLKILSVSIFVETRLQLFPPDYPDVGIKYKSYTDSAGVRIIPVDAVSLYNQPVTILITYEV